MLERLDQVNWARIPHAYGPATDVPDQIRALRSPVEKERTDALWELFGNIFHQGTRYEATAHAVPFLLEVLAAPDTPNRHEVLQLLVCIAIGYDETWLPHALPIASFRRAAEGGASLLAAAPRPGDDSYDEDECDYAYVSSLSAEDSSRLDTHVALLAYDAVRLGVPLFRSLLADPSPEVRTWAAVALAWFAEDAPESLPALAAVSGSGSRDGAVEATALVATGLLGGRPGAAFLRDPRPLVRWGAAIALAGPDAPPAVLDELLTWTGSSATGTVPFLEGNLAGYAGLALGLLGDRHADAALDALLARFPSVSGPTALPIVGEALRTAFPDGTLPPGTPYAALDYRQRRVVDALADAPGVWLVNDMIFANFSGLVRSYGLPSSHESLNAYRTVSRS